MKLFHALFQPVSACFSLALLCACSPEDDAPRTPASNVGGESQAEESKLSADTAAAFRASDFNPLRNAYFGDLHLHTSYSFDAAAAGVSVLPEAAYRYALGEEVDYMGRPVQRNVPLDFLAITDHAEYLGVAPEAADPGGRFADTSWPMRIAEVADQPMGMLQFFSPSGFRGTQAPIPEFIEESLIRDNWARQIDVAERYYQPGSFTTFVAFEWSPMPEGAHLHRNVIFKGPEYPSRPFSALDSLFPEALWDYAQAQRDRGMDVILIPHNSNLSDGLMFDYRDSNGEPLTRAYAEARAENERLVEITQVKGTSETRPEFSPTDEFAGFELMPIVGNRPLEEQRGGFVRQGLARGLQLQSQLGVNPFQLGFVGATDFHSGVSSGEEDNYPGSLGEGDSQADPQHALTSRNPLMGIPTTQLSAGGLTGIWAEQNTREALFDALRRREVFATSGPRMQIRMFAGATYPENLIQQSNWLTRAYAEGVPMGADLPTDIGSSSPQFLLEAVKDPEGANLDRIQIVKVWLEAGETHEKIFDALWNDDRQADASGRLPPVGNTVDTDTATYTNSVGAAVIRGQWVDPEFNPQQPALYYARVLEIPTPRWPTYLAVENGLPLSEDVPATLQERAWSSPIWYTP